MSRYLIAMGIRLVCILLIFVVQGWWVIVFAVGAIVLPYLAVVLANAQHHGENTVLRPGSIVPVPAPNERSGEAGKTAGASDAGNER